MTTSNLEKKLKIGSKPNIEIMGVPSSVSPREPAKITKNSNFDEDGVEEVMRDDDDEEEEDNVYYIDHENIMQI